MKSIVISLLLTISPVFATTQVSELWIIHGKQVYFDMFPSLKEVLPKVDIPNFDLIHTANYKGYNASWVVIDNQLYLVGLEAMLKDSKNLKSNSAVLKNVKFPVKVTNWSGTLIKRNPVSSFDPNTNKSERYDEVTTIIFKNGKLVNSIFDKKETKLNQ